MINFFRKKYQPDPDAPSWYQEYEEVTRTIRPQMDVSNIRFSVLDVEATGLDIHQDRIISFALIPVENYEMIPAGSFQCLVQQKYFDKNSVHIHGLRHSDINDGISEEELLKKIIPILQGTVIVGHHVGFDIAMINKALGRHFGQKLCNPVIDTGQLYKKVFPSQFIYNIYQAPVPSLDDLADQFGLEFPDRHVAMGDAIMTGLIFMQLMRKMKNKKGLILKDLL